MVHKILLFISLLCVGAAQMQAQTPTFTHGVPSASSGKSQYIFGANATAGTRSQFTYPAGAFGAGVTGLMPITSIYFFSDTTLADTITYTNISITMGEYASAPATGFAWATGAANLTQVLNATNIPLVIKDTSWFKIDLTTPYIYDPSKVLFIDMMIGGQTPYSSTWTVKTTSGAGYIASSSQSAGTPNVLAGGSTLILGVDPIKGLNNAGIERIVLPSVCANNQDAEVKVKNGGSNVINSLTIGWSINGVLQTPINLTSPIDTFGSPKNDTIITLGNVSYASGVQTIKAWTSMPNSSTDPFNLDDTVTFTMGSALNGTYTIGNAGNFASIPDAMLALKAYGVCSQVTFLVDSGTYFSQIELTGRINGVSATNTIEFKGIDKEKTILSWSALAVNSKHVIKLQNTAYLTFRDLTIKPTGTVNAWGIHMLDSCFGITIKNCKIDLSSVSASTGNVNSVGITVSGNPTGTCIPGPCATNLTVASRADSLIIDSNTFLYGYEAINIVGNATANKGKNHIISNNTILYAYQNSINLVQQENVLVDHNFIFPRASGVANMGVGIFLNGVTSSSSFARTKISRNKIHGYSTAGISLNTSSNADTSRGLIVNNMIGGLDQSADGNCLYITNSSNWSVANNSFNRDFAGTTANTASAIRVLGTSTKIGIVNNLIAVTKTGAALPLHILAMSNIDSMDRNVLYRSDMQGNQILNMGGTNYLNNTFAGAGGFNSNSVISTINYKNDTSLYVQNTCGFATGMPLSYVDVDIDNNIRSNPPIVGAEEKSGVLNNVALLKINQPLSPITPGTYNLNVLIQNNGINALNSFNMSYILNNNSPVMYPVTLTNPLTSCDTITVSIPGFTLTANDSMSSLIVYSDFPNASTDADPGNDTLKTKLFAPLAGYYTLGGPNANFPTFADATNALKTAGVKDAVTFLINAGSYNEQVVISGPIPGISPVNNITFDGVSNTTTSLSFAGNATSPHTLKIENTKYITIRNLSILTNGNANGYGIHITGNSNGCKVKKCSVTISGTGATSTSVNFCGIVVSNGLTNAATRADSLEIDSNFIYNGYYGISIFSATGAANISQFNKVRYNTISNAQQYSIYLVFQQTPEVLYNKITCRGAAASVGIYFTSVTTPTGAPFATNVSGNTITNYGAAGISINSCTNASNTLKGAIRNNAVGGLEKAAAGNGIYLTSSTNWAIINNSINRDFATTTAATASALRIQGSASASFGNSIINNVLAVTGTGTALPLYTQVVGNTDTIDYNLYYRADTFTNNYPAYIGANIAFNALKTGTFNKNSVYYRPGFTANNDLQPNINDSCVWALNGRGTHLSYVSTDINGNSRPLNKRQGAPDIGAFEFTPASTPPLATAIPDTIIGGTIQTFVFATDTVAQIAWPPFYSGSNTMKIRQFSGVVGPDLDLNFNYMYFYTRVGLTPVQTDSLMIYYRDNWTGTHASEAGILITQQDSGALYWVNQPSSKVNPVRNIMTMPYYSSYAFAQHFTGTDMGSSVPVHLLSLQGTKLNNDVILNWSTAGEKNAALYEIERSFNNRDWKAAGSEKASGNSNTLTLYQYRDYNVFDVNTAIVYYRLRMTDNDGSFTYSNSINVLNNSGLKQENIVVYPNPFGSSIAINGNFKTEDKILVSLYDLTGKLIYSDCFKGEGLLTLNGLEHLNRGIYFISINVNGTNIKAQKLIKN